MPRELVWFKKVLFQGWVCSACGWQFKSSGPPIGDTLYEMKELWAAARWNVQGPCVRQTSQAACQMNGISYRVPKHGQAHLARYNSWERTYRDSFLHFGQIRPSSARRIWGLGRILNGSRWACSNSAAPITVCVKVWLHSGQVTTQLVIQEIHVSSGEMLEKDKGRWFLQAPAWV